MKIVLAQGNPDKQYAKTRHNVGFMVVDELAKELNAQWSEKPKFKALLTEVELSGQKVILVKPNTFYNQTGTSARALIDFYKIDAAKDLLVVHDDLSLPLGTIRIRKKGSDAGNNGIKSVISHIGENFARIRVGIKEESEKKSDDAKFVLSRFNRKESKQFKNDILPHAVQFIKDFINNQLEITTK